MKIDCTEVCTTGEAARTLGVNRNTVIKWLDSGRLESWKVPGSQHRRVSKESLRRFIAEHGIPTRKQDQVVERDRRVSTADRNALIESCIPLVWQLARKLHRHGDYYTAEELASHGFVGLVRAADRFEPERGLKFITMAHYYVLRDIIRAKDHAGGKMRRRQVNESDLPASEYGPMLLSETLPDEDSVAPDYEPDDRLAMVGDLLARLNDRERLVIRECVMADDRRKSTLVSMGAKLGVTKERVRQIREKAIHTMRKAVAS